MESLKEKLKIRRKKRTAEDQLKADAAFVAQTGPVGGVNFDHDKYVRTGSGYEMCLYIHGYPQKVGTHWLTMLTNIEDTVCVIDISSTDTLEVKKNLQKSLEEQDSRYRTARTNAEKIEAELRYYEADEMYREISSFGQVMKVIVCRVYVPEKTLYEIDTKAAQIVKDLQGSFKASACLNETKEDYRNVFLSYSQQQQSIHGRKGQEILPRVLAAGNPFHYSALLDPFGAYFGKTSTGGAVLLDIFRKTNRRLSYDFLAVGKKGSGKSTLLKKIIEDRAIRGDFIRVFDVEGEFTMLTERLGGKVIYLDGSSNKIINILQVLANDNSTDLDDEAEAETHGQQIAFDNHMSKVTTIYNYFKNGAASENELLILKQLLRLLYMQFGICDQKGVVTADLSRLTPQQYPIFEDLLALTKYTIDNYEKFKDKVFQATQIRENKKPILEDIELKVNDICTTYGRIFNGHTTIDDFYHEKVVCFNIKNLIAKEHAIFDAQLFNALSVCFDNAVAAGTAMKNLVREKKIRPEDITYTSIIIDEAPEMINAGKPAGLNEVDRIMRRGRKYFTGIGLAGQTIRYFVPDGSDSEAVNKLKSIFDLTTYKFMMQQDSESIPKLSEIFHSTFSDNEINAIPTFDQGECILSISGDSNINFKAWISDEEKYYFDGSI